MYKSARSYVAIVHFNNALYNYSHETIFDKTIRFTLNPQATIDNCPPGRTLRDTGHTLIPKQTGLTYPMVSVFEPISGLSGYINPLSYHFITESKIDTSSILYKKPIHIMPSIIESSSPESSSPESSSPESSSPESSSPESSSPESSSPESSSPESPSSESSSSESMGSEEAMIQSKTKFTNVYYIKNNHNTSYSTYIISTCIVFTISAILLPYLSLTTTTEININ